MRVVELAPAKLNLTLDVGQKHADGYHDVTSVMTSAALCDVVTLESGMGQGITVTCSGKSESLGIPVPKNGEFYLDTRLAASRLGEGEPKFAAVPRRPDLGGMFVPISPEEPFRYLHRLENAFLARKDGQLGIVIPE